MSHFIPEFTPGRCRPDTTGTLCPADSDRSRSPSGLVLMRPGHCHLCAGARPFGSAAPVLLTPSPGVSLQAPSDSSLSFQCILGRRGRSWYRQRCSGPGQGAAVSSFLPQGLTWASSCRLWRPPLSLAVSFSGEKGLSGPLGPPPHHRLPSSWLPSETDRVLPGFAGVSDSASGLRPFS